MCNCNIYTAQQTALAELYVAKTRKSNDRVYDVGHLAAAGDLSITTALLAV